MAQKEVTPAGMPALSLCDDLDTPEYSGRPSPAEDRCGHSASGSPSLQNHLNKHPSL